MGSSFPGIRVVGLTGGIGSGKSTVSELLSIRGAAVIDSDLVARDVVNPGTVGLNSLREAFGDVILDDDGRLDRGKLASIAFPDKEKLSLVNSIVHPLIEQQILSELEVYSRADNGRIVVLVIPLLFETNAQLRYDIDKIITVDAPEDLVIRRLKLSRNMSDSQIRDRMANQLSRDDRNRRSNYVIDNSQDEAFLIGQIENIWNDIVSPTN